MLAGRHVAIAEGGEIHRLRGGSALGAGTAGAPLGVDTPGVDRIFTDGVSGMRAGSGKGGTG